MAQRPKTLMIVAVPHSRFLDDLAQRHEHVGFSAELHLSRKHADNFAIQSVDQNVLAEDIRCGGKLFTPQTVADQYDVRRSIDVLGGGEIATDLRFQSEHGEQT